MNILYLFGTFISIFILLWSYNILVNPDLYVEKNYVIKNKKIILTIPTFLDSTTEDRWLLLSQSIDSILNYNPNIYKFIDFYIINEYSPNLKEDWVTKIKEKYPFINFIQKTEKLIGQPETLNLILDLIQTYVYWVYWEDNSYCTRKFLLDAIHIMDNTKITQLEFSKKYDFIWEDNNNIKNCHKLPRNNNYCMLSNNEYSLRSSINRVKDYNFGKFINESEFGDRWMKNKYVKGVFFDGCVNYSDINKNI